MKSQIEAVLPTHTLCISNSTKLYIVDYKNLNLREVTLLEEEPIEIKYVLLENKQPISVYFDGFVDNALPISTGNYSKQCECVLFPASCGEDDWILFIETKYSTNLENAFRKENDYPNCMINQIIETVKYFRAKGIIAENRRVNAIVSFPNLIDEFNATFFTGELSVEQILLDYKILIRATNSGIIKSEKRLTLNSI
jgi:hypothetical protein